MPETRWPQALVRKEVMSAMAGSVVAVVVPVVILKVPLVPVQECMRVGTTHTPQRRHV